MQEFVGSTEGTLPAGRPAFSPDGATMATTNPDGTLGLWDVVTGTQLLTLEGHQTEVIMLTFLPDGKSLASQSYLKDQYFGPLTIWDLATGKPRLTLQGVGRAFFPSDGATIALSDEQGVKLIDAASGKEIRTLDEIVLLGLSPDGKTMVVGASSSQWLFDVKTWTDQQFLERGFWWETVFSPDSKTLAIRNRDTIMLINVSTGERLHTLRGHRSYITKMVFSKDGKTLFSGSNDGTIRVWDVATGQ